MQHIDPEILITQIESDDWLCQVCNYINSRLYRTKAHFIKEHGEDGTGDLECPLCKVRFNFNASFYGHLKDKHNVNGKLQYMSEFGNRNAAKDEKGVLICLKCGYMNQRMYRFKAHIQKHMIGTDRIEYQPEENSQVTEHQSHFLQKCSPKSEPDILSHTNPLMICASQYADTDPLQCTTNVRKMEADNNEKISYMAETTTDVKHEVENMDMTTSKISRTTAKEHEDIEQDKKTNPASKFENLFFDHHGWNHLNASSEFPLNGIAAEKNMTIKPNSRNTFIATNSPPHKDSSSENEDEIEADEIERLRSKKRCSERVTRPVYDPFVDKQVGHEALLDALGSSDKKFNQVEEEEDLQSENEDDPDFEPILKSNEIKGRRGDSIAKNTIVARNDGKISYQLQVTTPLTQKQDHFPGQFDFTSKYYESPIDYKISNSPKISSTPSYIPNFHQKNTISSLTCKVGNVRKKGNGENHKCPVCYKSYSNSGNMQRHINSTHAFPCKICKVKFTDKKLMEDHYFKAHVIHCELCNKPYSNKGNLIRHIRQDHARQPPKKPKSSNISPSFESLPKLQVPRPNLQCVRNGANSNIKHESLTPAQHENLPAHLPLSDSKTPCSLLPSSFVVSNTATLMPLKCDTVLENDYLNAKILNLPSFVNPHLKSTKVFLDTLVQPKSQVDSIVNSKETVDQFTRTVDNETFHIKKTSEGGGICLKCIPPKHFSQFSSCNRHYITVHSEDGEKKHRCLVCCEMFALKTNLNTHIKVKHGLKGRIEIFKDNSALAKTDAGEGACLLCKKAFSQFSSCKRHYETTHQSQNIDRTQNIAYISRVPTFSSIRNGSPDKPSVPEVAMPTNWVPENNLQNIHGVNCDYTTPQGHNEDSNLSKTYTESWDTQTIIQKDNSFYDENDTPTCTVMKAEVPEDVQIDSYDKNTTFKVETTVPDTTSLFTMKIKDINLLTGSSHRSKNVDISTYEAMPLKEKVEDQHIFDSNVSIDTQSIIKTETGGGICTMCNSQFAQYRNCRAHFIKAHGENGIDGIHNCLMCETKFNYVANLKDHYKQKHKVMSVLQPLDSSNTMAKDDKGGGVCLLCGSAYAQVRNLKAHFSKLHGWNEFLA